MCLSAPQPVESLRRTGLQPITIMFNLAIPWWEFILRGVVVYIFMLVLLRITGKRQVGQLAPFDLVLLLVCPTRFKTR